MMKKNIILFVALFLGMTVSNAQDNYVLESTDGTVNAFQNMRDASFLTEQSSISFFELSDDERAEKIDFFLAQNRKYLPKNKMGTIKETLMGLNEAKLKIVLMTAEDEFKDPTTALILSLFLGNLGIDRFYIGDTGAGIGKLLTFGGFGIWAIIDWFFIQKRTRNNNYKELMEFCGQINY